MTYRDVYSAAPKSNGAPAQVVEVRSHDSDALDSVAEELRSVCREFLSLSQVVIRYIQENAGAQARIQMPSPRVNIQAPAAPDVTVEAPPVPPPAEVTVNVPESPVEVFATAPIGSRWHVERNMDGEITDIVRIK